MEHAIPRRDNAIAGFFRHGYLLHIRTQCCANCGMMATYTSVNEVQVAHGGRDRRLIPRVTRIEPGFPVEYSKLPNESIPICQSCVATFAVPDHTREISEASWRETLKTKYAETAAAPPRVASPKKHPTIDDL